MLIPSASTIARWRKGESVMMDKVEKDVELGAERFIKKRPNVENLHDKAEETRDVVADAKGGKFDFTKTLYV